MKINEVCIQLNITKKAIDYYEGFKLIEIPKDEKGYRIFSEEHVKILREISLYRKLGISVANIGFILKTEKNTSVFKSLLVSKNKEIRVLLKQQTYIEKLMNSSLNENFMNVLYQEILHRELDDHDYILNRLKEFFPGGLGYIISTHFSVFQFNKITTTKQHKAWMDIVNYLDSTLDIIMPSIIQSVYDEMENDELAITESIHEKMKEDVLYNKLKPDALLKMKLNSEAVHDSIHEFQPEYYKEMVLFQAQLKKFFSSDAYRLNVLENMRILSDEYDEYLHKLNVLNEEYHQEDKLNH